MNDAGYRGFHGPRYAYVLRLLAEYGAKEQSRILDIGASQLSELMRQRFNARVDTLGFGEARQAHDRVHIPFDLNRSTNRAEWPRVDVPYDFVVMAEVIEHLHVSPAPVLQFLRSLMARDAVLLVQTPNAASLSKRIKLLLGRNPYEMIRDDPSNPGHFREYTARELREMVAGAGFEVDRCVRAFYVDTRFIHDAQGRLVRFSRMRTLRNIAHRLLPPPLREGITLTARAR